jgi:hypothetical protein
LECGGNATGSERGGIGRRTPDYEDAARAPRSRDFTVAGSMRPSFTSRAVIAPDVRP